MQQYNESGGDIISKGAIPIGRAAYNEDTLQVIKNLQTAGKVTTNREPNKRGAFSIQDKTDIREGVEAGLTAGEIGLIIHRSTVAVERFIVSGKVIQSNVTEAKVPKPHSVSEVPVSVDLDAMEIDAVIAEITAVGQKLISLRNAYISTSDKYVRKVLLADAKELTRRIHNAN
jgi:hypothetical protein